MFRTKTQRTVASLVMGVACMAAPTVSRAATPGNWEAAPKVPNPDRYGPRSALLQVLLNPAGDDLTSVRFVQRVGRSWLCTSIKTFIPRFSQRANNIAKASALCPERPLSYTLVACC